MFYVWNKSRTVSVPTIPNKRPHAQKSILALNSFCVHPKARCIYQLCFIMVSNPVNPSSSRELIIRKQREKNEERKKVENNDLQISLLSLLQLQFVAQAHQVQARNWRASRSHRKTCRILGYNNVRKIQTI